MPEITPDDIPDTLIAIAGEAWRTAPQKRDRQPTRMRYALAAAWNEIEKTVREQVAAEIAARRCDFRGCADCMCRREDAAITRGDADA